MTTALDSQGLKTATVRPQSELPGPDPMPILGWKGTVLSHMRNPLAGLTELNRQYGDIAAVPRGGNSDSGIGLVAIFGDENNRILLSRPDSFYNRPPVGAMEPNQSSTGRRRILLKLGPGLFGMNGPEHRHQRTDVTPAFRRRNIPAFHDQMVIAAEKLLRTWAPDTVHYLWPELMSSTLSLLAETLMQIDLGGKSPQLSALLLNWLNQASSLPVMLFQKDLPGTPFWRFLNLSEAVEHEMMLMIKEMAKSSKPGDRNVLAMLRKRVNPTSGCPYVSDDEICGHLLSFLLAGQTTAPSIISWTMLLLSQHPQIAESLYEEVENVLGERTITPDDLDKLPLLEKTIKEMMRLFSPVPITGRYLIEPVEMSGYLLQPGSDVVCSIFHAHRNPKVYKDPNSFNPRRWDSLEQAFYQYLPFSAGAHNCIGAYFAMQWMIIVISMILQRFRLSPVPNSKIDVAVNSTSFPAGGLPMTIHRRDEKFAAGVTRIIGSVNQFVNFN